MSRVVALVSIVCVALLAGCGPSDSADRSGDARSDERAVSEKITVAGDSISVGLGAALRGELAESGPSVEVVVIGEEGTGLARPDMFDWPARLEELARDFPPEVLVFSVGSNDAQPLLDTSGDLVAGFDDVDAWERAYAERLERAFDAFADTPTDTTVVWVGHVHTAQDDVGSTNRRIHRIASQVAATRDHVAVFDLGELLGTGDAVATRCLTSDGLHLSVECLDEAAEALVPQLPLAGQRD